MTKNRKSTESGRFAYEGLDRVLHEKARLGILTSLISNPDGLVFGELKDLCSLTDGNLSRHLQTLEKAGLVDVSKAFHEKRPQTTCWISTVGKKRFLAYLEELDKVIRDASGAQKEESSVGKPPEETEQSEDWAPGWT